MADDELRRELGFWDALTIGVGTMIGAGIFLLAGVAVEMAGPAAIFSYIFAGVVCAITAAATAEFATGMPTSGGDYYFVSRSMGPALGAVSGIGIWLSLTFAISFYLFGMGEYIVQVLPGWIPVTPLTAALVCGALLIGLNVVGAKESGNTQVFVVMILLLILGIFTVWGLFNIDPSRLSPFFPGGFGQVMPTTALIFVSFLGFVKIAAVSEEIEDPSTNLPLTLIGSVVIVTTLYILIVLVIAGQFPQAQIAEQKDPLTATARMLFGTVGAGALIFAGLLATLSSANASIMASSRINLAMSRDGLFPEWFKTVNDRFLTPMRAILLTGILSLVFLFLNNLELLAKFASVLQLYSYAALNVGCALMRISNPDWYKPTYRAPGFPFLPFLAALCCLGIIVYSGPVHVIVVIGLILFSMAWYFFLMKEKVDIRHGGDRLLRVVGEEGIVRSLFSIDSRHPTTYSPSYEGYHFHPERALDPVSPRTIVTALANPQHEADLLKLASDMARGVDEKGTVYGLHVHEVPRQTSLESARKSLDVTERTERITETAIRQAESADQLSDWVELHPKVSFAHDVFGALIDETYRNNADCLLMGWQGGFNVGRIYNSPVQRIMRGLEADLAVLKDRGLYSAKNLLLPWGGGTHARLGLELAHRIARSNDGTIELLRIVREDVDEDVVRDDLLRTVNQILPSRERVSFTIRQSDNIAEGILESITDEHDLLVIGASDEWKIKNVLFGTVPDVVADRAPCSVMMVRHYVERSLRNQTKMGWKRIREQLGWTTSPLPNR